MNPNSEPTVPIPKRVVKALERMRPSDREHVYVLVGDWPDVRMLALAALHLRGVLHQASTAMLRGHLSSRELVEGMASIRRLTSTIESVARDLAKRARVDLARHETTLLMPHADSVPRDEGAA